MRDLDAWEVSRRRKTRSVAIVAVSLVIVAGVALSRVHLGLPSGPGLRPGVASKPSPTPSATASPARSSAFGQPIDVQFLSRTTGWVFTTNRGSTSAAGLFSTVDGGATWTLLFEGPPRPFHFFDNRQGYVTSLGTLLTTDGGATWHPFPTHPGDGSGTQLLAVGSPTDALALVSAPTIGGETALSLYRTVDAGGRWSLVLSGTPDAFGLTAADLPYLQVGYSPPALAWISGFSLAPASEPIVVSRDSGATWARVPISAPRSGLLGFGPALSEAGGELTALVTWVPADTVVRGPNGSLGFSLPVTGPSYVYTLRPGGWSATVLPSVAGGFSTLTADAVGSEWVAVGATVCHAMVGLLSCHQNSPAEPQALQFLQRVDGDLFAVDIGNQSIVTSADGGNHWTIVPKPRE